jgi:hypothetical protein
MLRAALSLLAVLVLTLALNPPLPCRAEKLPELKQLSKAEVVRLGERMYRDGLLPSGEPMPAFIRGDVEVDSRAFSCSSCHLRAGLGSFEGGVVTPPTTGLKLYKPYRRPPSITDSQDQAGRFIYAKTVQERVAYNRDTLAAALRLGVDPSGQPFNDVMPRYPLTSRDMAILIAYLEGLSSEPSPGASAQQLRFATIITEEVSREDREALLIPLASFVEKANRQRDLYADFLRLGYSPTIEMKDAFRGASLDVWELKGKPETWRSQLEEYYRREPVFLVLGGISYGDWRPMHDFCEERRLPCLFPITDFPVVSETSWYTYYFNKGYFQEGDAVARYLDRREAGPPKGRILQLVQDSPEGKALAEGFMKGWHDREHTPPVSVTVTAAQLADPDKLGQLLDEQRPEVLLIWADAQVIPLLPRLASRLPDQATLYLSSSYLGRLTASIAEPLRQRVYLSYPFRLTPYVGTRDFNYDAKVPLLTSFRDLGSRRVMSRTNAMLNQVTQRGLNLLYDNLYRDHLYDVMSMQMDQTVLDYERFSFGPGQRYVSKGCYVIQLGPGAEPELLPRTPWVEH